MLNVMVALPNIWWRPLFNTAKFGWRSLLDCRAVTLPRCETRWNLPGCPKLPDRSQPLVGRRSPYCGDMWRRYCCLTIFSDCWYVNSCEDIAPQSCAMVPRWPIFGDFCGPAFPASRVQDVSDLHSKFALGPHHVCLPSMVDIQCAAAEIRRGKKKKIETTGWKYNGLPYSIGRPAGLKYAARGSLIIQDAKITKKIVICALSHNFVRLASQQSEKKSC